MIHSVILRLLLLFLLLGTILVMKHGTNDENVRFGKKSEPKSNKMIPVGNDAFITSVFALGHDSYG